MKHEFEDMSLAELAHTQAVLNDYLVRKIALRRREGSTWAGIAIDLGVSTSAAHKRWAWLDKLAPYTDVTQLKQ